MAKDHPLRKVVEYSKSWRRHQARFEEFRVALAEAAQLAEREPGCDWKVGALSESGTSFLVEYAGLRIRYRFGFEVADDASAKAAAVMEVLDEFEGDDVTAALSEPFDGRAKTDLRYFDDNDEVFLNRPAGARETFLLQVGRHLGLLS